MKNLNTRSNIHIGELNRRITIQEFQSARDELTNEEVNTWIDSAEVWAKVKKVISDERYIGNQEYEVLKYVFTIRYNTILENVKNRIVYDNKTFDVVSYEELGNKDFMIVHVMAIN